MKLKSDVYALEGPRHPKAVVEQMGAWLLIKYDYRKGRDLYLAAEGELMFCCQCTATFPPEEFQPHVLRFYRKRHEPDCLPRRVGAGVSLP